jgi:hypothetical protein
MLSEQGRHIDYSISHDSLRAVGWIDGEHYLIADSHGNVSINSMEREPSNTIRCPFPIEGRSVAGASRAILLSRNGLARLTTHFPPRLRFTHFPCALHFPYFLIGKRREELVLTANGYLHSIDGTGKCELLREGFDQEITACMSYGERKVVIGTRTGNLLVVDIANRHLLAHYSAHAGVVTHLLMEGSHLLSIGRDSQLIRWLAKGARLRRLGERKISASHFLNCMAIWKDRIIIGDAAGYLHIVHDGSSVETKLRLHKDSIRTIDVNSERGLILTDSDDGTVAIADLLNLKVEHRIGDTREYIRTAAPIIINTTRGYLVGTSRGMLHIVLPRSTRSIALPTTGGIRAIEQIGDRLIAVGHESGALSFFSIPENTLLKVITLNSTPYSIRDDPERNRILVGLRSGHLAIINKDGLTLQDRRALHHAIVGDICILRDRIVTCSDDGTAKICEPAALREIHTIAPNIGALNNIAAFGSNLIFTSDAGAIVEFALDRSTMLGTRSLHESPIRAIAVTANGLVVTGDRAGRVVFCNSDGVVGCSQFTGRIIRLEVRSSNVFDVIAEHEIARLVMHEAANTNPTFPANIQTGSIKQRRKATRMNGEVVNVLHLSDPHFAGENREAPIAWRTQLEEDLTRELRIERLDGIIVSGDMATVGLRAEFELAAKFLAGVMDRFACPSSKIMIVPGNHDVDWSATREGYRVTKKEHFIESDEVHSKLEAGNYVEWISNAAAEEKLRNYRMFHAEVTGRSWPLTSESEYCELYLGNGSIYCAGLNSAWQTDHHFPKRISLNRTAFANTISRAGLREAERSRWKVLVVHHPIGTLDDEKIPGRGELQQLSKARFNLVLHGHIHKPSSGRFDYDIGPAGRSLKIIGAGTFGAMTRNWEPGFPLGYNLLRFYRDRIVVETRRREEPNGAWTPDARWVSQPNTDPIPRYELIHPEAVQLRK